MTFSTSICQSTLNHHLPCNCVAVAAQESTDQRFVPHGHSFSELANIYAAKGDQMLSRHYARFAEETR